jgi:type IV pilus assembly protein PilQ
VKNVNKTTCFLALTLLAALCAQPARAQAPSLDARVNLSVADRPLEDVVATLRARSGANIVILNTMDPANEGQVKEEIGKRKVTIDVADVGWRDALSLVAESAGLIVEQRQAGVLAVLQSPPISYDFKNADIVDVITTIASLSGANIVLSPDVKGTLSVHFVKVPWREALEVVAKTRGYVVVQGNYGVLRVVDPKTLQDQLETKTYQLRYIRPKSTYKPVIKSEFLQSQQQTQTQAAGQGGQIDYKKTFTALQALSKALSTSGQLDYIDTQNVVIVRDTAQVHESIREMLTRIDVEPAQVFCDVKFVSTTNGDVLNLGIDYGDAGPQISLSGGQIPVTLPFDAGPGGWEDWMIVNENGGPFTDPANNMGATVIPDTIFGALSFTNWQMTLRLLQRDTKTEVIQAPKLIALDGSEATIFVGETIRYAEAKSEQGQAGGLQLVVSEAAGSPVEIGFQLLVRPNIIPGTNRMVMEIIPKETSLSGTGTSNLAPPGFDVFTVGSAGDSGSIALPRTRASTIVTTMMLETGQTAVIGGLSSDADTETQTEVPGLADIPLLGELFKHRSKQRERRTLLVFVTPTIVRNSQETQRVLDLELQRRRQALKAELENLISVGFEQGATGAGQ